MSGSPQSLKLACGSSRTMPTIWFSLMHVWSPARPKQHRGWSRGCIGFRLIWLNSETPWQNKQKSQSPTATNALAGVKPWGLWEPPQNKTSALSNAKDNRYYPFHPGWRWFVCMVRIGSMVQTKLLGRKCEQWQLTLTPGRIKGGPRSCVLPCLLLGLCVKLGN